MRGALILALLVGLAVEAGRFDRTNSRCAGGRSARGLSCDEPAFLEVAPANGTGMTAACACTAITGTKGETITHSRSTIATCSLRGAAVTGIADGDIVTCLANQPRVEPDAVGTLGIRTGGSRTNLILRNVAFDNAVWNVGNAGVAAPTRTADFAPSPGGGTTAERIQIPACPTSGTDFSIVFQNYTGTVATYTNSFYVRGTSGSGSVLLYAFDPTAVLGNGVVCNYVSTSWTRCEVSRAYANTTHRFAFGCINLPAVITNGQDTGAADFLVSSAQSELGPTATPPIATVGSSVTRGADIFTAPYAVSQSSACFAATVSAVTSFGGNQTFLMSREASGSGDFLWLFSGTVDSRFQVSGSASSVSNGGSLLTSGQRFMAKWNGTAGTVLGYVNGTQIFSTSGLTITMDPATILGLGQSAGTGNDFEGIISRIQADTDPDRCSAL